MLDRKCANRCGNKAAFMAGLKPVCSTECAYKISIKHLSKERNIKHKKRKEAYKENDLNHQHSLTKDVFNKMRRLECMLWFKERGRDPECISCGKKNMDWACGHLKTVGSAGSIRYDRKNTYLQCNKYCNESLSGNVNGNKTTRGYINGLHDLFGKDAATDILDYLEVEQHKIKRWNGAELKQMRKEFSEEIRRLERILND